MVNSMEGGVNHKITDVHVEQSLTLNKVRLVIYCFCTKYQ